jgi:hypothetical protein
MFNKSMRNLRSFSGFVVFCLIDLHSVFRADRSSLIAGVEPALGCPLEIVHSFGAVVVVVHAVTQYAC